MGGMILVKSHSEENLLLQLVGEFASKVVMPRSFKPNDTFKKYADAGVYGITGVEVDSESNEALFQIELPGTYIQYIVYEIEKLRSFVAENSPKQLDKNIRA